ncbi:DNA internalization-related competence protein ComEC/Rec2 [Collibacillus ludicampi]|uniref:DNA internalization-related competence protein ComEC/Rec2 n=1 Tax=Collibacillus ludicampi TaxID=2771369 RepID=UPI002493D716|nr:DNA internalization-related competence protein ComEC/Rec2 [Collibacillus ludicampi]
MRRLLFQTSILFAVGAVWPPLIPRHFSPLIFLLLSLFFLSLSWFCREQKNVLSSLFLSLALLCSGSTTVIAYLEHHPPAVGPWLEKEVRIRGIVQEIPIRQGEMWVFPLEFEQPFIDRVWVRTGKMIKIQAGDCMQVEGTLRAPSLPRNPGAFNEKEYLFRRGIHAVLVPAEGEKSIQRLKTVDSWWRSLLATVRERVEVTLRTLFSPGEAGFLGGLLCGWTDQLDHQMEESFSVLGITHILAASGMNVALLVMPVWWLLARLSVQPWIRLMIILPFIAFYVGLAGATPSVLRAGIMASLLLIGKVMDRPVDLLTLVGVSAWVSIFIDPLILWDLGFQLSYGVTIGLIVLTPRLTTFFSFLPSILKNALAATLAAELVSVPLLIHTFHIYTPVSILANLYVAPFVAVLVPLGFLLLFMGLLSPLVTAWLVPLGNALLYLMLKPVLFIGKKEWLLMSFASPSPVFLASYYGGLLLLVVERLKRIQVVRKLSLLMIGVYLVALWCPVSPGKQLLVTFLDVGQGDSIFIRTPSNRVILVDGGGAYKSAHGEYNVGEKIVVPYLRNEGVRQIDMLILSHPDQDHMMGLFSVLHEVPVKSVLIPGFPDESESYKEFLALVQEKEIPLYLAHKGDRWDVDQGLSLQIINPPSPYIRGTRRDVNANCIVFELDYGNRSFLFTGDVEGEVEPLMQSSLHPVDALKVAHHGSKYSTSSAFLQTVHPRYAIISVGKNNRYGHPDQEVLERLEQEGARMIRTDEAGAVLCRTDGENLTIEVTKGMHK